MRDFGFVRESVEIDYLVAEKAADIIPMVQAAHRRTLMAGVEKRVVGGHL
jgi:hypothetical protein